MSTGYLRYPAVHGDEIVFIADNDLWLAPLAGGRASRLTVDRAPSKHPVFSPDGRRIAWTSWVAGMPDVYVLDRDSGDVTRLTWWSEATCATVRWADDSHVIVASGHAEGYVRRSMLYSVALDNTYERLPLGPAMSVAYGPEGAVVTATPCNRDSAMWKRYRGGTAARLWLDPHGAGEWRRVLPDEAAGLYAPDWLDGRLFFSADIGDVADLPQAQLWSVSADGGDLRRHTQHTDAQGYVRDPRTDGTTIVYHARGVLYAKTGLDGEARVIEVETGLGAPRPLTLQPTDGLDELVPDHRGNGSLLAWRGAACYLTHRAGPARALAARQGVRVREVEVLGDTGRAAWVSDADGDDRIEIAALAGDSDLTHLAGGRLGRVLHLAANPAGTTLAAISHDGRVSLVDAASGEVTAIAHGREGEPDDLAWSPDGRYLVWREPVAQEGMLGRLLCFDTTNAEAGAVALTSGRFDDSSPSFSLDGKYLCLLSARTLDPRYDAFGFDLGFTAATRPWLVPLRATDPAPFGDSADGWPIAEVQDADEDDEDEPKAGTKPGPKHEPPKVEIDSDGFEERMVPFPVPSGEFSGLQAAKKGVLWLRHADRGGVLGSARAGAAGEPPADQLERFDFETRKVVGLGDADSFGVSGDGERVVVRHKDELVVLPADHKVEDDDPARVGVDLSRLRREVDRRAEWRQMFDENGRLMRDHYWREDFNGVDWAGVLERYRPLVDRLASHDDLVDLLWETVGELNTSHAYVMPSRAFGDPSRRVGLLGIDAHRDADGSYVIDAILPGESSDPQSRSPLRAPGVGAKPGDRIVAVDGRPVADAPALGALLGGSVDKVVELTLARDGEAPRRVAVVPIGVEETLRYHAWVAGRAAYVEERSGGRLGYLHVPDMMSVGWAQLHRMISQASRREGVIADMRYNRGGHTSQLVIERLSRVVRSWGFARHLDSPETYPVDAMRGPVVFVCNQWSGSDGDIVNAVAQTAGIGPVVGERTWGGVVGIDGRFDLVDGTSVTQPRYATWIGKQGWDVENHGVDPDIVVELTPADWESDTDPQLDRAMAEAFALLEVSPAAVPPELPAPRFVR